jgi:hypothetical protein
MIGIESELAALDFDLACAMRLLRFDNQREFDRLKAFKLVIKEAFAETLGALFGVAPTGGENGDEPAELSEDDVL